MFETRGQLSVNVCPSARFPERLRTFSNSVCAFLELRREELLRTRDAHDATKSRETRADIVFCRKITGENYIDGKSYFLFPFFPPFFFFLFFFFSLLSVSTEEQLSLAFKLPATPFRYI